VIEGKLEAGFGVAGDGEECVGSVVAYGSLTGELEAEFVGIEVEAPVEI
jgi:hypothetical protein